MNIFSIFKKIKCSGCGRNVPVNQTWKEWAENNNLPIYCMECLCND